MSNDKQALLVIASRLFGYPSNKFMAELEELSLLTKDAIESKAIQDELTTIYEFFGKSLLKENQELYVSTFDLQAGTSLYLTAHELGDSNKRGAALIRMQKLINEAGFERVGEELADYIPMLMEFLAVSPKSKAKEQLEYRIAVVLSRIRSNLDEKSAYTKIINLLTDHVFPNPSKEEIEQLENNREEADLEELPYPMLYQ